MDPVLIPRLTTERLLLREWLATDREPFGLMNADPLVVEHLPRALDRAASDALIERFQADWAVQGHGRWALVRRDDDAFLGFVGLHAATFDAHFTPAVDVGWRLARAAWGRGYATEGARAALRYAFETLALDEVVSYTVPANVRSRAVMERLGMTHDPRDDFDHPAFLDDRRICRHVLYRLTRTAWSASRV
jgi:RimJ/RimL family protein N-acetyltransferase